MFRTDDMYGDYPTLEEIKRDYDELLEMVGNVTTIEQTQKIKDKFTIEINGLSIDEFVNGMKLCDGTRVNNRGTDKDIEWIRYEAYGCLSYIYFCIENGIIDNITFDVWSNKHGSEFITGSSIDNIMENYDKYIEIIEEQWKGFGGVIW